MTALLLGNQGGRWRGGGGEGEREGKRERETSRVHAESPIMHQAEKNGG